MLDAVMIRICETDLVPSRASLLDDIQGKFSKLKEICRSLADLRDALKNEKSRMQISGKTGIHMDYLILLRREIEGYFPKPAPLRSFDWLPAETVSALEKQGLKNTASIFDAFGSEAKKTEFMNMSDLDRDSVESVFRLADLTRIQWVSPVVARMLAEAGCPDPKAVADADPETLCADLSQINAGGRFFNGTIGLRDIKRLVQAASYVH